MEAEEEECSGGTVKWAPVFFRTPFAIVAWKHEGLRAAQKMNTQTRDYLVYYVLCPDDGHHFILGDPADPKFGKTPPRSPNFAYCLACGPKHRVKVTQEWGTGCVSGVERAQGFSLTEPESRHE